MLVFPIISKNFISFTMCWYNLLFLPNLIIKNSKSLFIISLKKKKLFILINYGFWYDLKV